MDESIPQKVNHSATLPSTLIHILSTSYPRFIPNGDFTMSDEQQKMSAIKNFENQIRLFLYDNFHLGEEPQNFFLILNLLSNVVPPQYLFGKYWVTSEVEEKEELSDLIRDHFNQIMKDFRFLAKQTVREENVKEIWKSFYQVYVVGFDDDYHLSHALADIAR